MDQRHSTTSVSNDNGYIWANNALGAGFSFTAPASTTEQTLSIYLGGFSAGGTLTAALSDGTVIMSQPISGSSNFTDLLSLSYASAAPGAGQTISITYTKTQNIGAASGSLDLIAAWLTPFTPTPHPQITLNPQSQTVVAGANVTFTAAATSSLPETVQWRQSTDGGNSFFPIAGATNTTFTLNNVSLSQSGDEYDALFSNANGLAGTSSATLTVASLPTITTQPTSQSANQGANASFTAAASGTPTPTVQWEVSTNSGATYSPINGATATTLTVNSVASFQNGFEYEAIFSNSAGTVTTTSASLQVVPISPPMITLNPISQSVQLGQTATFTAAATGNPTPTVDWEVSTNNGGSFSPLGVVGTDTLQISANSTTLSGNEYRAIFTNSLGTIATTTATLTVTAAAPPTAGGLSGNSATAAASYNLTTLGASDWAHWGTGNNAGSFIHDATGGSQISNVTKLGPGSYGSWYDSTRDVSWTNGAPTASNAGDDSYIWANNAIGAGYSFTVPANTTARTLSVYLGGFEAGGTLTAHLSDGSAPDYSVILSGTSDFADLATINFVAASAGQSLTITYVKTQTSGPNSGSVDLIAAWLTTASTPVSPGAPTIVTNPQSQSATDGSSGIFTAAATGTPSPTVQWEVSSNHGETFNPIGGATSTTLTVPGVTPAQSGWEYEAVFANSAGTLATTPATLTVIGGGSLIASQTTAGASYNLTTLGTLSWAAFGRGGNAGNFDVEANDGLIGAATPVGGGTHGANSIPSRSVSWTNGSPTAVDANDNGYLWANNAIGAGYQFIVGAGTGSETLYVYLGGFSAGGTLTAHLTDNSAPDVSAFVSGSGTFADLVGITFNAATGGEQLVLTYTKTQTIGAASGSVDLMAAWLVQNPTVLDQSFNTGSNLGSDIGSGAAYIAQTVTAGVTGYLTEADLSVNRFDANQTTPWEVTIQAVNAQGVPTGTVLATQTLPPTAAPTSSSLDLVIDFSSPAFLTAGEQFAIVVSSPGFVNDADGVGLWAGNTTTYSGGQAFTSQDGNTFKPLLANGSAGLFFTTHMTVVPAIAPAV